MADTDEDREAMLASAAEGTYFERLEADRRERVIDHLEARIDGRVSPTNLYGLVLVLFGVRPACLVTSKQRAITREQALAIAEHHDDATRWDPVGQFLDRYELPFTLLPNVADSRLEGVTVVNLNYHVSLDEERVRAFEAETTESPTDHDLSREDEQLLGGFLGYPTAAIEAYCDRDHMIHGHLIETVDAKELEAALGPLTEIYDALDLDYRAFTRYLLPYVAPATIPECLERYATDATRAVMGGFIVRERYDCRVLDMAIAEYNDRFAPMAE